jgi:hypothetical protein
LFALKIKHYQFIIVTRPISRFAQIFDTLLPSGRSTSHKTLAAAFAINIIQAESAECVMIFKPYYAFMSLITEQRQQQCIKEREMQAPHNIAPRSDGV